MPRAKSILLIEDDKDDQWFFVEALSTISNVTLYGIANNGKEALSLLKASDLPDLIFSDIQMPEMNGIECLKAIKQDPRTKNIPFVMLSSSVTHSDISCKLGARAFINKTPYFKTLCDHINQQINFGFVLQDIIPGSVILTVSSAA